MKTENRQTPDLENENEPIGPRINDEQTNKRIHEHLANEDDVITPEDISNAITEIEPVSEEEEKAHETEDEKEEKEKHIKDNTDPEIDTPWNILSE